MNHHFVPQFYLQEWINADGKLWRYKKEHRGHVSEKPVSPRGTAFEPNLYSFYDTKKPQGSEQIQRHPSHVIETEFFSKIDGDAAVVLVKLQDGKAHLDDTERKAWALFLRSLTERHASVLTERDALAGEAAKATVARGLAFATSSEHRERLRKALEQQLDVPQLAKNLGREAMIANILNPKVIDHVKNMMWIVAPCDPERLFVTTDKPLLLNAGEGGSIEFVSIAISPTKLFIAYPAAWAADDELSSLLGNVRSGHDTLLIVARPECLYSSRRLDKNDPRRLLLEERGVYRSA